MSALRGHRAGDTAARHHAAHKAAATAAIGLPAGKSLPDLDFSTKQLSRFLQLQKGLLARAHGEIAEAERVHGDDDARVEPRHVEKASKSVQSLMNAIWAETKKKTLDLDVIEEHLPAALARLIKSGEAPRWERASSRSIIEWLAREYQASVLDEGRETGTTFYRSRGLQHDQWDTLRTSLPALFSPPAQSSARKEKLAELHEKIAAGKVPPEVSNAWREIVIARAGGIDTFLATTGLSKSEADRLRREHPKLFEDPPALPLGTTALSPELAEAVAKSAAATLEARPLATVEQIVEAWNDSPAAKIHGDIDAARYYNLRTKNAAIFPDLVRGEDADELIDRTARDLLADNPKLEPEELAQAVTDRLGPLKPWRLKAVAQLAKKAGGARQKSPIGYVNYVAGAKASASPRSTLPALSVYRLAVRASPPGTTWPEVVARANEILKERGVDPAKAADVNRRLIFGDGASYEEYQAGVAAKIVAEYARAAPKGTPESEILKQVVKDYPGLSSFHLNSYRAIWAKHPDRYPEIAPLLKGKAIEHENVSHPRFIGGWDVKKSVLGVKGKELAELLRLVEAARTVVSLPLVNKALARYGKNKPLAKTNVVWVAHLLGNTFPLGRALMSAGAAGNRINVVGSPYGSVPAVADALRAEGMKVEVPPLDEDAYRAEVKKAIDRAVEAHRKNHDPIIVVDDGGLVAEILHSDEKYADILGSVRIVEQTTRGIIAAQESALKTPVIAYASSDSKACEAAYIGRIVATKMLQAMARLGKSLEGEVVTVVGFGLVGRSIAAAAKAAGAKVLVVEPSEERAEEARDAGFKVTKLETALPKSGVVFGATGKRSLPIEALRLLKDGAFVASASSKRLELDMGLLETEATERRRIPPSSPALRLPTVEYELAGRKITVVGDGWPINFDGDVDGLPADEIDVTLAGLLLGAIQASSAKTVWKKGVVAFDEKMDAWLLGEHDKSRKGREPTPISNPDGWADIVLRLGGGAEQATTKGVVDLATRLRLKDRSLAQELKDRWDELPPFVPIEERLEKLLGEPVTFQQFNRLRAAHEDLLGELGNGGPDPAALEHMAKLLAEEGRPSLDVMAERFNEDPILSTWKRNWTRGVIKHVIKTNPKFF